MATDYKYLKENNLYEAHKAFMRLCEGYGYSPIEEDDDAEQQGGAPQDGWSPNGSRPNDASWWRHGWRYE